MFFRSDVGATGGEETLFYCEVVNDDKVSNAASVDGVDLDGWCLRMIIFAVRF